MKSLIVFYSMTGNTECMANAIADGITANGGSAEVANVEDFAGSVEGFDAVLLGCPAMGAEVLEEMQFEPFYQDVKSQLVSKKVAFFGTYDWGDGQWMRDWVADAEANGITLVGGDQYAVQQEQDIEGKGLELAKAIVG